MNHPNRSKNWLMTPAQLETVILEVADGNQSALARMVGVDGRTVRRWIAGEIQVPKPVQVLLRILFSMNKAQREQALKALEPTYVIPVLDSSADQLIV